MKVMKNRRENLLVAGKEKSIDAFLISGYDNIYYFSGFKTLDAGERAAFLLVTAYGTYLFSDGRYFDEVTLDCLPPGVEGIILSGKNKLSELLGEIVRKKKIMVLGFEAVDLRVDEYMRLKAGMSCRLEASDSLIMKQRESKNRQEILNIKKACLLIDRCLELNVPFIREGQMEKEIAGSLAGWLKANTDGPAFAPIVAIDSDSALPHFDSRHGRRKVRPGSLILIDCGAESEGYRSDITRIFFYRSATKYQQRVYRDLLHAQLNTIKFLTDKKNLALSEADNYCRGLLVGKKYPPYPHSLGHGIGLQTHEQPRLSVNSPDLIRPGQVFTVEPGIYFSGRFGMRIEDTVTVKEDGRIEVLTRFPKTIMILNKK